MTIPSFAFQSRMFSCQDVTLEVGTTLAFLWQMTQKPDIVIMQSTFSTWPPTWPLPHKATGWSSEKTVADAWAIIWNNSYRIFIQITQWESRPDSVVHWMGQLARNAKITPWLLFLIKNPAINYNLLQQLHNHIRKSNGGCSLVTWEGYAFGF